MVFISENRYEPHNPSNAMWYFGGMLSKLSRM
jgi:hypothetical protein